MAPGLCAKVTASPLVPLHVVLSDARAVRFIFLLAPFWEPDRALFQDDARSRGFRSDPRKPDERIVRQGIRC